MEQEDRTCGGRTVDDGVLAVEQEDRMCGGGGGCI